MGVSAHAQIVQMRGDDTGGSIPWSADNEIEADVSFGLQLGHLALEPASNPINVTNKYYNF